MGLQFSLPGDSLVTSATAAAQLARGRLRLEAEEGRALPPCLLAVPLRVTSATALSLSSGSWPQASVFTHSQTWTSTPGEVSAQLAGQGPFLRVVPVASS